MAGSKSLIKEEPDDRSFIKAAHFVPTNKMITLTQDKGGGICIPMKSELKRSMIKRARNGGFLKLINQSTGQEVIVPTLPYLTENESVVVMDTLDGHDLTELEVILRQNADHQTVDKIRDAAETLQEEALTGYKVKKAIESLPKKTFLLVPSFYCARHRTSLSFTSTASAMSAINQEMLQEMKSPILRLHHDPRVPPTISPLFERPPPPEECQESAYSDKSDKFEMIMNFTREFREKRLKFGITQFEVVDSLYNMYGLQWSQTTISRFEGLILGVRHTWKVMGILKRWLEVIEAAVVREECHSTDNDPEEDKKHYRLVSVQCSGRNMPLIVRLPADEDWVARRRKKRTLWTQEKIDVLENAFQKERMPKRGTITQLANAIDEPPNTIRIWFCNRRAKYRRMNESAEVDTSGILNIDASELTIVPQSCENA